MQGLKRLAMYGIVTLTILAGCIMNVAATDIGEEPIEIVSDEDYGEVLGEIVDDVDSEYYGMEIIDIEEEEIPWGETVLLDEESTALANTGAESGIYYLVGTIIVGLGLISKRIRG